VVKEDRMVAVLVVDSVVEALEVRVDVTIKRTSEVEDNLEINTTIEVEATTGRNPNTTMEVRITSIKEVTNQAMVEAWLTMEVNVDVVDSNLVVAVASARVTPVALDMRTEADLNATIALELMACLDNRWMETIWTKLSLLTIALLWEAAPPWTMECLRMTTTTNLSLNLNNRINL
jgi:hypothetical protein